jgi:hypothetical protein
MKNIVNEELNYMKYLFDYQRGKVISEQTTNKVLEKDGCEKGFYRDCTTKTCVKTPKASVIVYSQEEFEKEQKIYQISKEHNRKGLHYAKVDNEWAKKSGWTPANFPAPCGTQDFLEVGLPSGKEKVVQGTPRLYNGVYYKNFDIINQNPSACGNGIKLSSYKNDLKKKGLRLSGMCIWICEGSYYPLLKITKPILACLETPVTEFSSVTTTTTPIPSPTPTPTPKPQPVVSTIPEPTNTIEYPEYNPPLVKKSFGYDPKGKILNPFDNKNHYGGFYPKYTKKMREIEKYYYGYDDQNGNHIDGEIEKAKKQNRRINFLKPFSNDDTLSQKTYNDEFDEYLKKRNQASIK